MQDVNRTALAFAALQRFWVVLDPAAAERHWQNAFAFEALSSEQKQPGQWYRNEGEPGYINVALADQGEFHQDLPPEVDPASVIVIPQLQGIPSVYDRMKELIMKAAAPGQEAAFQEILNNLDELRSSSHASRMKSEISSGGMNAYFAGKNTVPAFLRTRLQELAVEGLNASKVTGEEIAALLLLDSLAHRLAAATPEPPASLAPKMFDPTFVPSLSEMTARFIADCWKAGMGQAVNDAIDEIRRGGDATLAQARALQQGDMHPGVYLDHYYQALQQAGIRFFAVRWGCQSVLAVASLESAERSRQEKRANAAEEKSVRMNTALLYALKDIDGVRYRSTQQAYHDAIAAGDHEGADAILYNVFDSQMYYPQAVRAMLCQPAEQASANSA